MRIIAFITGTRADWGLLSPVARALAGRDSVRVGVVATNMHLLRDFGHTVDEVLTEAPGPVIQVPIWDSWEEGGHATACAMGRCTAGMANALAHLQPDTVVILGDRFEALAAASAATAMRIPIVHIAGGETSLGAVDEGIRHAITKLASLHLVAAEPFRRRVIQMGEDPARVITTGAVGVYNLLYGGADGDRTMTLEELEDSLGGWRLTDRALLATVHPATADPDGTDSGQLAEAVFTALDRRVAQGWRVLVTYPNNDPGSEAIVNRLEAFAVDHPAEVRAIRSLGRRRYLCALAHVRAVVGNSSSGLVEVPSARIPTVNVGSRQLGRLAGASVVQCPAVTADAVDAVIGRALSPEMARTAATSVNPYDGGPQTLDRMVRAILEANPATLSHKPPFHDLC